MSGREGGVVGGKMRKEYGRKTSDSSSQTVSGSMSASHDHLFSHDPHNQPYNYFLT